MTFEPAAPDIGEQVIIEVKSRRGHADIALTGPDQPAWDSVDNDGTYYYWRWRITYSTAGSRTYSFTINGGALTCETGTVTVAAATETPTATDTPEPTATDTPEPTATDTEEPPSYGVSLSGDTYKEIAAGATAVFNVTIANQGNVDDTFNVSLQWAGWAGWSAEFCSGGSCAGPGSVIAVPLSAGGSATLSVNLSSPDDEASGREVQATLSAVSQADPGAAASHTVTAHVQ